MLEERVAELRVIVNDAAFYQRPHGEVQESLDALRDAEREVEVAVDRWARSRRAGRGRRERRRKLVVTFSIVEEVEIGCDADAAIAREIAGALHDTRTEASDQCIDGRLEPSLAIARLR